MAMAAMGTEDMDMVATEAATLTIQRHLTAMAATLTIQLHPLLQRRNLAVGQSQSDQVRSIGSLA